MADALRTGSPSIAGTTLSQLWESVAFKPNDAQRQAILHSGSPLYLPAGPGSGKTRVLLWRTVNLLVHQDVQPEEVFLSTFTEKAALQLKEGLRALLGTVSEMTGKPYDVSKMYVGTVHSLCQRLLTDRRFARHRQRHRAPVLIDELEQYLFVRRRRTWEALLEAADLPVDDVEALAALMKATFNESSKSKHKAISNLIALFNRLSEECIDPAEALRGVRQPEFKKLLKMYASYRQLLEPPDRPATVDFPLIQQRAMQTLEAYPDAGKVFKHVIIDEYQDTNTIQERIFFKLASGHRNICVVGDDDQALYRFRGATVENFVEFPARCKKRLGVAPRQVVLNTNYRSRSSIVSFYCQFMEHPFCNWRKDKGDGCYRVADKNLKAARSGDEPAVVATRPAEPEDAAEEIAELVQKLIQQNKVQDPNQIAFLFPSLKSKQVGRMKEALEKRGLSVYAPRAGCFLEVEEAVAMLGVMFHIIGRPQQGEFSSADYDRFHKWVELAWTKAKELQAGDSILRRYVTERRQEVETAASDYQALSAVVEKRGWDPKSPYQPDVMRKALADAAGLSDKAQRTVNSPYFDRFARRIQAGPKPLKLSYAISRATSLDWNLLDLFYQLCGHKHFRAMFDLAERGTDEGPICNLSLVSQYLSTFLENHPPVINGEWLRDDGLVRTFGSYLYVLFRRGESEFEDAEDPFPKGRIPFITIHQAKGLEFPVVVLGNPRKDDRGPQAVEEMVQPLLDRDGEPLDRMSKFDIMRMFYVALSRAENLLVIAHYTGRGQRINEPFASMLSGPIRRISQLSVASLPAAKTKANDLPRTYSYTGDYLLYRRCPRQYMIYRHYDFAPSRSQTMFFGSLVHQTLEDLHQMLISQRSLS